ncbi:MAG: altronate dehydratase family protein [Spirochaetaceae bacterium]|jgi:altronate hydrolase|nr:altronate dehydratase family protein [Spirochaetaceae bacterium]
MSKAFIVINEADNAAVALEPLEAGFEFEYRGARGRLLEAVGRGHKFALRDIAAGGDVIKYGAAIGAAVSAIPRGAHIHVHNLKTSLCGEVDYRYEPGKAARAGVSRYEGPALRGGFLGYPREKGGAGVRNEVWIIPTVGCVNGIGKALEDGARERYAGRRFDGVVFFPHAYGCSQMGDDQEATQKILAGLAVHPNAGGVLVLGLGCENNNIAAFKPVLGDYDAERVRFFSAQESGDEIAEALVLLDELVGRCEADSRREIDVSALRVGLKCGGSDGLSGVTANPLVGRFSDLLLARGGTSVLTEVPEMFGAEAVLLNRCADEAVFERAARMINGFKRYYERHNQVIYENPSPGNKAGGISTLEDKSLGCVQKGGAGIVTDVLRYGDRLSRAGLSLLEGPGNDIVAVTALAAAGAHIILFTTGRGTPLGSPVPVIKIATNSALAAHKKSWIDFDAGVLTGEASLDGLAALLYEKALSVSCGEKTKNEERGFRDIAIFKDGVIL